MGRIGNSFAVSLVKQGVERASNMIAYTMEPLVVKRPFVSFLYIVFCVGGSIHGWYNFLKPGVFCCWN